LKITLVGRRTLWCVIELLPQESAFVGRFRCGLQRFFLLQECYNIPQYLKVIIMLHVNGLGKPVAGKQLAQN